MHVDNSYALPSPVSSDRKVDLVFSDLPLQEPFRSHSSPLPLMQVHCRGHPYKHIAHLRLPAYAYVEEQRYFSLAESTCR
jgi:hypothetical protein